MCDLKRSHHVRKKCSFKPSDNALKRVLIIPWFTLLTQFTLWTWFIMLTWFILLTWFTLLTWLALLTGDGWIGRMGHTPETVTTVTNIAVIAHDGFWKHTPLTLFTLLSLLDDLHYVLTYYPILTAWVIRSWKI